jgi:hypothetical protein
MRHAIAVAVIAHLLAGCGSKTDSAPSEGSSSGSPSSSKAKTKEQKATQELESQLVAPPAEVVAGLGAEVYPGARMLKSFKAVRSDPSIPRVDYIFFAKDPPKTIQDFYKARLTDSSYGDPAMEKMGGFVVKGKNSRGEEVTVQAQGRGELTTFHFVVLEK